MNIQAVSAQTASASISSTRKPLESSGVQPANAFPAASATDIWQKLAQRYDVTNLSYTEARSLQDEATSAGLLSSGASLSLISDSALVDVVINRVPAERVPRFNLLQTLPEDIATRRWQGQEQYAQQGEQVLAFAQKLQALRGGKASPAAPAPATTANLAGANQLNAALQQALLQWLRQGGVKAADKS